MAVKLLLDENVSPRIAEVLRSEGIRRIPRSFKRGDMVNTVLRVAEDDAMIFEEIPPPVP